MKARLQRWLYLFRFLLFFFLFFASPEITAREEKGVPSQKTKEAIAKFKGAASALGKSVEALKEAGKARLQGLIGSKPPAIQGESDSLSIPAIKSEPVEPTRYSPAAKRDPFRPVSLRARPSQRFRQNLSPLERYELGQLKLVGIVWDIREPRAMVEDDAGLGYVVKVGTLIGPNQGRIKDIKPTEIVIEESYIDFNGTRKNQRVTMKLPSY